MGGVTVREGSSRDGFAEGPLHRARASLRRHHGSYGRSYVRHVLGSYVRLARGGPRCTRTTRFEIVRVRVRGYGCRSGLWVPCVGPV